MSNECDDDIVDGEFDSVEFASYLYQKARAQSLVINATKLQKWLYICYGVYLAGTKNRLLRERPKAWPYGPVFPKVYRVFNSGGERALLAHTLDSQLLSASQINIVEQVLRIFGNWSANELSNWTHKPGEAWHRTKQLSDDSREAISDPLIFTDFKAILRR